MLSPCPFAGWAAGGHCGGLGRLGRGISGGGLGWVGVVAGSMRRSVDVG